MMKINDSTNADKLKQVLRVLPPKLQLRLGEIPKDIAKSVREVRLRADRPFSVFTGDRVLYLTDNGCFTESVAQNSAVCTKEELAECFNTICGFSVYSHISEIVSGFVTIRGGHRAGICGTAVHTDGAITNIRDITSICIRVCREIHGCADELTRRFVSGSGGLLLCGGPGAGKTTVLRDMSRLLSTQYARRVALVDTRSELAGVYRGECQCDIGMCDVLDAYPRLAGISHSVRCLSPDIVVCDEIGGDGDAGAILSGVNSGVDFVSSMHASELGELRHRRNAMDILATGAFSHIAFLCGAKCAGTISKIYTCEEAMNA